MDYILKDINKGIIKALKLVLSKDDTRQNLKHVYCSKDDHCVYATDGHKLMKAVLGESSYIKEMLPDVDCYGMPLSSDTIVFSTDLLSDMRYPNVAHVMPLQIDEIHNTLISLGNQNNLSDELALQINQVLHILATTYDSYDAMFNYIDISNIIRQLKGLIHLHCYKDQRPCKLIVYPCCKIFSHIELFYMPIRTK